MECLNGNMPSVLPCNERLLNLVINSGEILKCDFTAAYSSFRPYACGARLCWRRLPLPLLSRTLFAGHLLLAQLSTWIKLPARMRAVTPFSSSNSTPDRKSTRLNSSHLG